MNSVGVKEPPATIRVDSPQDGVICSQNDEAEQSAYEMTRDRAATEREIAHLRRRIERLERTLRHEDAEGSDDVSPADEPLIAVKALAERVRAQQLGVSESLQEIFTNAAGYEFSPDIDAVRHFRDVTLWLQQRAGLGFRFDEERDDARLKLSVASPATCYFHLQVARRGNRGGGAVRSLGAKAWTLPSGLVCGEPVPPPL